MPVHVERREGSRPYKIVAASGKIVGSSKTLTDAEASARVRNEAHAKKGD